MAELTQAQIDALMQGNAPDPPTQTDQSVQADDVAVAAVPVENNNLTQEEIDTIGEIGNISMGNSATVLSKLLNRKIRITTPVVSVITVDDLVEDYPMPYVAVEISYTEGMKGKSVLNIKIDDVKIITDIMMGGSGEAKEGEINDLHLSAMGELMNQMMGSAATAMSQMISKRIDISPPKPIVVSNSKEQVQQIFSDIKQIVRTVFTLSIEGKGDSEIMQLMPMSFAKELAVGLKNQYLSSSASAQPVQSDPKPQAAAPVPVSNPAPMPQDDEVKVKYLQFHSFGDEKAETNNQHSRYDILMDIPLEVSVELGSVRKSISEILTFGTGTVIELNKLAGEHVDIVINNRIIGKGEVIVVDESYGVRITEVLK